MGKKLDVMVLVMIAVGAMNAPGARAADLQVTEIMFESSHPVGYDPDPPQHNYWWELTNAGASSIDLTGYSWDDNIAIPGAFVFPSITIAAGESIIILEKDDSNQIPDVAGFRSAWDVDSTYNIDSVQVLTSDSFGVSDFPGLGYGGVIYLFDPSDAQVGPRTLSVAAGIGVSIHFPLDDGSPVESVVGQYEAWEATLGDVGSPGVVPEPTTMSLLALGLGALAIRRRKKN